ncbi:uncharacterized protein [Onthophagus taurus]|uniref:uncharacterized protein n=1 Tax=Onthophagus taurus TaxID=166361 RepID=UPI0039BEB606
MFKLNEKTCDKIFVVVYIVCFCTVSIYMYSGKSNNEILNENINENEEVEEKNVINAEIIQESKKIDEDFTLNSWKHFLNEYIGNKTKCYFSKEFDEKPKSSEENETVIHISILLLQTSLIWTIVDFVDRYMKRGKKKIEKPPLHRTCSLADMTLMRHQRRESMRKDLSLDARFPSRMIVSENINRRCSLPLGGPKDQHKIRKDSIDVTGSLRRRMTINSIVETPQELEHKRSHVRLLHRH